ncbi:hypothetical protein TKWG_10815 [Advenella kashmirensis WT001]|uniref:Uncharacterized protein n=1 Tax=Advenella kashmirensis (strain DSM 17095 / LMG 22695 / WT001) TaxID=1036672 RepID=I3UBL9_ADVKW|nr:hypothetical protein TKWG_10815 [Advenella kashmirensis WT001]
MRQALALPPKTLHSHAIGCGLRKWCRATGASAGRFAGGLLANCGRALAGELEMAKKNLPGGRLIRVSVLRKTYGV